MHVSNRKGNKSINIHKDMERQINITCGKLSSYLGQDTEKIICNKICITLEPMNVSIFFIL